MKIMPLAEMAKAISALKKKKKRIVLAHGVFDLLHPGHIRHLEAAKAQGDILVVTVTPDNYVNKGPGRPVFNQRLRAESLAALQCVDYVAVNQWPTAVETIRLLRPDVYVKGHEYAKREADLTGKIYDEEQALQSAGGRLHFTQDITFSSTHLLNSYFEVFPPETDKYLRELTKQHSAESVISFLKSLDKLKVLVIGDAIIDEYHFCQPYGKASKSSVIASRFLSAEAYAGGALAAANHIAGFCKQVHLVTCLGEQDSREEFIKNHLRPNVSTKFFSRPDAPTVIKRRYVQPFLVTKMFEVAFFNEKPLPESMDREFCEYLKGVAGDYDLVVVADFGHGLVSRSAIHVVCEKARFLAVNAQTNSVNLGYNLVTKYPRADYICIDEEETRLALHDRFGPVEKLMEEITRKCHCRLMAVTRGNKESVVYDPKTGFITVPLFSREVVDTIGAGDAFLSVTAACACAGFPPELIGFVGNAVGALAVRIVGNKESVEPVALFKFITTLLK